LPRSTAVDLMVASQGEIGADVVNDVSQLASFELADLQGADYA